MRLNWGLYNLRARRYGTGVRRFLSRDMMEFPTRYIRELNGYSYGANSPVNGIDPSGDSILFENTVLKSIFVSALVGGGLAGGVSYVQGGELQAVGNAGLTGAALCAFVSGATIYSERFIIARFCGSSNPLMIPLCR